MRPSLKWIVARLGQDMNWWVDETSEEVYWGGGALSLLDPKQVSFLREELQKYLAYGFKMEALDRAFHPFEAASDLSDGRLRLVPSSHGMTDKDVPLFALPDLIDDEEGAYADLLDQLAAMRIRMINATHHYFQQVTEDDMDEDVQARNSGRYFEGRALHVFHELEDILTWSPAEWDEEPTEPLTSEEEPDEPNR